MIKLYSSHCESLPITGNPNSNVAQVRYNIFVAIKLIDRTYKYLLSNRN